jgi:hypothetical protein
MNTTERSPVAWNGVLFNEITDKEISTQFECRYIRRLAVGLRLAMATVLYIELVSSDCTRGKSNQQPVIKEPTECEGKRLNNMNSSPKHLSIKVQVRNSYIEQEVRKCFSPHSTPMIAMIHGRYRYYELLTQPPQQN